MQTRTRSCYGNISRQKLRLQRFANGKGNKNLPVHERDSNRALVVDDVPEICRLNSEFLMDLDFDVDVAKDGILALELLEQNEYDLIITDNLMPRMSGVELLKKLHATRKFVPVIMATGTMPGEEVTRQPWFQIVTTLIKPYTLEEFLAAVKRSIRKSSTLHTPA
jgi:two-component system alkaline phosphatase synthesis response regulator PhoP